jgi:hypothetical protein
MIYYMFCSATEYETLGLFFDNDDCILVAALFLLEVLYALIVSVKYPRI